MAKTMTTPEGGQVVVADVHLFLKGAPDPVSTFRHEALHVVLAQRDESLSRSRETILDRDGLHPDLVALAGIVAEEYRVERAVPPRAELLWAGFEALTVAAHNAIRTAAVAYFYDHDVPAIWETVMRAFSPMTVQAAYIAAWLDAGQLPTPSLARPILADRMLGVAWPGVLAALRTLPDATIPANREALDTAVVNLAHRLDEWLEEIGFGCEQLDDGQLYFHVYEHEEWATRAFIDESPGT
jgi:hypothetical protein